MRATSAEVVSVVASVAVAARVTLSQAYRFVSPPVSETTVRRSCHFKKDIARLAKISRERERLALEEKGIVTRLAKHHE